MAESLHTIAQRNTLGIGEYTATPFALIGQHIVDNKYIAPSGRICGYRIFRSQGVAIGLSYVGFQPLVEPTKKIFNRNNHSKFGYFNWRICFFKLHKFNRCNYSKFGNFNWRWSFL